MKILAVEQIREADAYTIRNEPISDIDLMERAATACFYWMIDNIPHNKKIKVFCGSGNNGGDGLAIARLLIAKGYHIGVFLVGNPDTLSRSCKTNYDRLLDIEGFNLVILKEENELPSIDKENDVIIDAIFGSGLAREINGFLATIIYHINNASAMTISIDVPSGLYCDSTNATVKNPTIIHADYTLTFAPPKLAFFFPENDKFVGDWQLLDIGIMQEFIDGADTRNFLLKRMTVVEFSGRGQNFPIRATMVMFY